MSAGAFQIVGYETSDPDLGGVVMPIRVQPETLALNIGGTANAASGSAIDFPIRVQTSAGNTEYGVKPRKVTLRFTDQADLPDGYKGTDLTVPVMTPAAFASYTVGATGTYLTKAVQVVAKKNESYR